LSLACGVATHTVGLVRGGSPDLPAPGRPDDDRSPTGAAGNSPAGGSSSFVDDAGISVAPIDWDAAVMCDALGLPATRKRLDLYMIVDNNFSIELLPSVPIETWQPLVNVAWNTLVQGIESYIDLEESAGTGVGLKSFTTCNADYETPDVEILPLPDNAQSMHDGLDKVPVFNPSPMVNALQGALVYVKSRANAFDDEARQALVLISDGYSAFGCSTPVTAQEVVRRGLRDQPAIPTYVIALDLRGLADLLLDPLNRFDALDAIAAEGGTGLARRIELQNSTDAFVDAMLEVQRAAEPCEYAVPPEVREEPGRLSLGVSDPGGLIAALPELQAEAECGNGYYLDADRNWATLCPSVCAEVKRTRANLLWFTDC
jgi:hypothetical protein